MKKLLKIILLGIAIPGIAIEGLLKGKWNIIQWVKGEINILRFLLALSGK